MLLFSKAIDFRKNVIKKLFWCIVLANLFTPYAFAGDKVTVDLVIDYKLVNFAGKLVKAIAVNGQIPGPTLHFKQGDDVTINVYNHLNENTSVHWHGLIVPWQMDGVAGLSQPPIPPGGVFHYQFTLHQSGTYWYHAHEGMQEQQGLYGALIIDPPKLSTHYDKDIPIILSDWSNTSPNKILANLKKKGDYYSNYFPLQPSLTHFLYDYFHSIPAEQHQLWDTYWMMQTMRMSPYDFSDVAYDVFLLNGYSSANPWQAHVKPGDRVRLRFINAGSSTFFNLKLSDGTMKVIHVQGNDVKPFFTKQLRLAPAETYDVVVKINNNPIIIYAESVDTSGSVYGALLPPHISEFPKNSISPFPEPKPQMMMAASDDMSTSSGHTMSGMHHAMNSDKDSQGSMTTALTEYKYLQAAVKTNDPNKPYHVINISLSGYMDHYMWFMNGEPESKAKPILIVPGQRYRVVFTNNTMMYHPMHLHGHWLILRNGYGAYDPLLHTINIPPGEKVVADFDANASGQWYFHCHNLYHMMSGMANTVSYFPVVKHNPEDNKTNNTSIPTTTSVINKSAAHKSPWVMANSLDLSTNFYHNDEITYKGLIGTDNNKLELFINDAELNQDKIENADMDIFYWRLISEFWAMKGGVNYVYRPAQTPYWQPGIGIEGTLPFFIETDVRSYVHKGSVKLDLELEKDTQLTNKLFLKTSIRGVAASKTVNEDEIGSGLNQIQFVIGPYYQFSPTFSLYTAFESKGYYGETKDLRLTNHDDGNENIITVGISLFI